MTRRERMERRLERRLDWADGRRSKAAAAFKAADRATEGIPFGQPILVGHYSEKRHRAALDRQDRAMHAGVEHSNMASHHTSKAHGIELQLEKSIFSDDPDAPERLRERIEELEAKCALYTSVNKAWRKTKGTPAERVAQLKGMPLANGAAISEKMAETMETTMRLCPWLKAPLDTTNTRANIRRLEGRLKDIEARRRVTETLQAEEAAASDEIWGVK